LMWIEISVVLYFFKHFEEDFKQCWYR